MTKRALARTEKPETYNGKCSFFHFDNQCPFPGVWCDSPKGNPPMFCHWHAHADNRRNGVAQQEFFSTYAKDADCIKDTLEMWYGKDWREEMIQSGIAKHPEWQRTDDEAKSAYVARMTKVVSRLK